MDTIYLMHALSKVSVETTLAKIVLLKRPILLIQRYVYGHGISRNWLLCIRYT